MTLAQAARVADLTVEDFLDALRSVGVAAVDYPASELEDEVATAP